ncbi:MAG: hypothetical protein ACYC69_11640 [Thermodesulfovibrionales bacterium]
MKQSENLFGSVAVICLLLLVAATGTAFGESSYSGSGVLYLSQVDVLGVGRHEVFLKAADKNGQEFYLQSSTPFTSAQPADATFDQATGILHIPDLTLIVSGSLRNYVSVDMLLVPGSDPMKFRVTSVIAKNLPYAPGSTITGVIDADGNIVLGGGFSAAQVDFSMYAVDFGTDASGFVCSCTQSEERSLSTDKLYLGFGSSTCIIMKGDFLRKNSLDLSIFGTNSSSTIMFFFPDGTSGFHFICVKS